MTAVAVLLVGLTFGPLSSALEGFLLRALFSSLIWRSCSSTLDCRVDGDPSHVAQESRAVWCMGALTSRALLSLSSFLSRAPGTPSGLR